jgi:hypothetical protein
VGALVLVCHCCCWYGRSEEVVGLWLVGLERAVLFMVLVQVQPVFVGAGPPVVLRLAP